VSTFPAAELRVVGGPSAGHRVPLEPGEHRVGSHRYSRVVLRDGALARVHLVVLVDPAGVVTVAPAGDATCLLDGERLTGPARLRPGQLVAAGRSLLAFGRPGDGSPPSPGFAMAAIDAPRIEAPTLPPARASGVMLGGAAAGTAMAAGVTAAIWGPPAALVPIALGPVAGFGALAWNRRGHLAARARFRARLAELDHALTAVREGRLAELATAAPDAAELVFRLESGPLAHRTPGRPDWLRLRLGWADQPSGLGAVVPARGAPALRTEAIRVAVRHDVLRAAPVALALPECGPLGIAGDREEGLALARWLAVQVAGLHAPEDVALTAALPAAEGFDWLGRLPRAVPHLPALAVGADAARALVDRLAALVVQRSAGRAPGPDVVAILHCRLVPAAARALSAGRRVGVHVIWLDADDERRRACGAVVDLPAGGVRPRLTPRGLDAELLGGADGLTAELARRAAGALRRAAPTPEARRVEIADLLRARDHPEQRILTCWIRDRAGPPPQSLCAALGVDAAGRRVELDMRRGGPHVVLSGGPGTGKTELLRAVVASLAARHAPRSVDLLLLGAFPGLAGLPHVSDERLLGRHEAAPALVVAVDELPPARLREVLARIAGRDPSGVHLLVATREPEPVEAIVGPALRVTMGDAGGEAVARDAAGRTWELQTPGTSSLPPLVAAIEAVGRSLGWPRRGGEAHGP
jgi:S-DNA-T family DNA segregation ATPase FtsK/SpoIIIE